MRLSRDLDATWKYRYSYEDYCRHQRTDRKALQSIGQSLEWGLRRLPNVHTIAIAKEPEFSGYDQHFPFLFPSNSVSKNSLNLQEGWPVDTRIVPIMLQSITQAVYDSKASITHFSIFERTKHGKVDFEHTPQFEPQTVVHPRGQHAMAQYYFFQNLRQLSLALYPRDVFLALCPRDQSLSCFPSLIKDSPTLQDVCIDFRRSKSSWSSIEHLVDDLIQVFGADETNAQGGRIVEPIVKLPRLQRIHLTNFAADVRKMSQIFRTHLGTLKEVVLRDGYLVSTQAGDGVVADMRALHLEKLVLQRIWPAYRLVGVLKDPNEDAESREARAKCKAEAEAVATAGMDAFEREDCQNRFEVAVRRDEEVLFPRIRAYVLHETDVHPANGGF